MCSVGRYIIWNYSDLRIMNRCEKTINSSVEFKNVQDFFPRLKDSKNFEIATESVIKEMLEEIQFEESIIFFFLNLKRILVFYISWKIPGTNRLKSM